MPEVQRREALGDRPFRVPPESAAGTLLAVVTYQEQSTGAELGMVDAGELLGGGAEAFGRQAGLGYDAAVDAAVLTLASRVCFEELSQWYREGSGIARVAKVSGRATVTARGTRRSKGVGERPHPG